MDLREAYRQRLRQKPNAQKLLDELFVNPYTTGPRAASILNVSAPTARQAIGVLLAEGVLEEIPGRSWRRLYLARPILDALESP